VDPKVNLRVADPVRTAAVVNTHRLPTIRMLLGEDEFDAAGLEEALRKAVNPRASFGLDFSKIAETHFGATLFANVMLLGAAYQLRRLPLALEHLHWAMTQVFSNLDREENLRAFELGRRVAAAPERFNSLGARRVLSWEVIEDKARLLRRRHPLRGRALAKGYRKLVEGALRWMELGEKSRAQLAQYVYDLIRFGGTKYARSYVERLYNVHQKDSAARQWAATLAVLENLYRAMIIKDEVYVAQLLTSEEKRRRDRERFQVDEARGDRLEYIHWNRPRFVVFGKTLEFNWKSRDWQLRIMRHAGFLRRLLPQWHAREKAFRALYTAWVDRFQIYADEERYRLHSAILDLPREIRGYREVREKAMDKALAEAEDLWRRWSDRRPGGPPRTSSTVKVVE
jgi:indolepyruvate ferredoxin oxidoreductase